MTDQELSEILAHPRVRAFVERIAEDAAARAFAKMSPEQKVEVQPKARPAGRGDLNYADAAAFIGCPVSSVRGYVSKGNLERGKLRATVTIRSCRRFKTTYRPCPNKRIPEIPYFHQHPNP